MGPTAIKRRRNDKEASKSKPKFKKVKRQAYHSSSEDEDEDHSTIPRASDAPKPKAGDSDQSSKLKGNNRGDSRISKQSEKKGGAKSDSKPKLNGTQLSKTISTTNGRKSEEPEEEDDVSEEDANLGVVVEDIAANNDPDEDMTEDAEDLQINTTSLDALADEATDEEEVDEYDVTDEPDLESDADDSDGDDDDDDDLVSETSMSSSQASARNTKKRNDPTAFATSISRILDTKLTAGKRADPVLSRSKSAFEANKTIADEKLEQKARAQIRNERKLASERGRVRDTLGLQTPDQDTGAIVELEKRLKKTAQRGVVKLFNAVRAAQVKGEEAMRQARSDGVIGMQQREEKANEMSKQGFLDLISSGGKKSAIAA